MYTQFMTAIVLALILSAPASAQNMPGYYPAEGFQRTGRLDDVRLDEELIVVNDIPYRLSSNVVIHSLSAYSVPAERLKAGMMIGYKLDAGGRLIMAIWLLPDDYRDRRRS